MDKHYVRAVCINCDSVNQQIQVKSRVAAIKLAQFLNENSLNICHWCEEGELEYKTREVKVRIEEPNEEKRNILEAVKKYIEENEEPLILKEKSHNKWKGLNSDKNRLSIITEEQEEDYEYYGKIFGNVATVYLKSEKEEPNRIIIGTNEYPKQIMRELAKIYKFIHVSWSYDQLEPPEWHFCFEFKTTEELIQFLTLARTLRKEYVKNEYVEDETLENPKGVFVFGAYETKEKETHVFVVEKEDWDLFHEFVHEYEHELFHPIQEIGEKLNWTCYYESRFSTTYSLEEVKKECLKYPEMVWDESFQAFVMDYKKYEEEDEE